MSDKKVSRYRSWPRWAVSTFAGLLTAAFMAVAAVFGFGATMLEAMMIAGPVLAVVMVAGFMSELVLGALVVALEALSSVSLIVLAPLALLESCG